MTVVTMPLPLPEWPTVVGFTRVELDDARVALSISYAGQVWVERRSAFQYDRFMVGTVDEVNGALTRAVLEA